MDDPWGSPWAATDTDKDQQLASPDKLDIAPPPRAFLSASSSPRIPAVPEQSPWGGDDDGFGEWATASETPPAHSVWAGGWGGSSPNLAVTPRDDLLGKASPIAWPGSVATPKPSNGSALRQPSPDPWASGFSSGRPSNEGVATPRLVVEAASPVVAPADILEKDGLGIEDGTVWSKLDTGETSEQTPTDQSESDTVAPEDVAKREAEDDAEPVTAPDDYVRASVESASRSRDYQSSTPSNDSTDHEEEHQDSPGTSIDEEPRSRKPVARKASGKVQELVIKFDGLARAASEERDIVPRGRSKSPLREGAKEGSEDARDFGDVEDADEGEPPLSLGGPTAETAGEPAGVSDAHTTLSPPPVDKAPSDSCPITRFGPLDFPVDLDSVSKLFTALPEAAGGSTVDSEVPDHVINDSFTEISERKTWYRISRLGSSRRHNAADDDSYRRVAWPSSTVHHDTIKIVRRWMEEDSIAGRVALGGGISKTQKNMFGWDSSAEPVALAAVFGKRKTSHSRASSLQPVPTAGLSFKAIEGPTHPPLPGPTHRSSGSVGPALPSFGWGSSSPASVGHTEMAPKQEPRTVTPASPDPEVSAFQGQTVGGPPVLTKPPMPTPAPVPPSRGSMDEDEDDEWGEMVSSPVVPQHPTNVLSFQQPIAATIAAVSAPQVTDDPWGAADFSVFDSGPAKLFDSGPAKSASHPPASPAEAKTEETSASASKPAPAANYPAPTTKTTKIISNTSPTPTVGPSALPVHNAQDAHEEAAQHIITNLPDLSYMLR